MAKGVFLDGPWKSRSDFEIDYANAKNIGTNIECPGCNGVITCNRWAGIGEGPGGWCLNCKRAVGPAE